MIGFQDVVGLVGLIVCKKCFDIAEMVPMTALLKIGSWRARHPTTLQTSLRDISWYLTFDTSFLNHKLVFRHIK